MDKSVDKLIQVRINPTPQIWKLLYSSFQSHFLLAQTMEYPELQRIKSDPWQSRNSSSSSTHCQVQLINN